MLTEKYFGIPFWAWIIITIAIFYLYNKYSIKSESFENAPTKKVNVYNFNTSWCGWSKKFQKEWDKFMGIAPSMNINAVDVKCDQEENESMCNDYGIEGFPTVKIEKDGKVMDYQGDRTVDALVKHMKSLN